MFFEKLATQIEKSLSPLCVGLDPNPSKIQQVIEQMIEQSVEKSALSICDAIFDHNKKIIDATHDVCACYKPNAAFYECWGIDGLRALEKTLEYIPTELPVILDVKRGDIGSTASAYAKASLDHLAVDAVTLAPYMGEDSIKPFLQYKHAGIFVLVRTSNPSADVIQQSSIVSNEGKKEPLYSFVAEQCVQWSKHDGKNRIGFVVAANEYDVLSQLRKKYPHIWFLSPGIGVQGGDITVMFDSLHDGNQNDKNPHTSLAQKLLQARVLPVVARGIASASDPRQAAKEYNANIHKAVS